MEPVAGFPPGTPSAWTTQEQQDLRGFLAAVRDTKSKILLTSRQSERGWLGELPARVELGPMPLRESVRLAAALAAKHQARLDDVEDWRPLLRYCAGNPLTITLVVSQALRQNLTTRADIEVFVGRLQAGEDLDDADETLGGTRSLGASLRYGYTTTFTPTEQGQLSLLAVFQGFAQTQVLTLMGNPALPEHLSVLRAYSAAVAALGNYYHDAYGDGDNRVIVVLAAEEVNLLHARRLALTHGWSQQAMGPMQGLQTLYAHRWRSAEWARLVDDIIAVFVDADTGGPLPHREQEWSVVTQYRVGLARAGRDWAAAEHLQHAAVDVARRFAEAAVDAGPDTQRNQVRTLVAATHELGEILQSRAGPTAPTTTEPPSTWPSAPATPPPSRSRPTTWAPPT